MGADNKQFYENIDRNAVYTVENDPENHPFYPILVPFIERWHLQHGKKCLEVGSSKGLFQNLVDDYTGVDIAESLRHHYVKNFVVASDETLPFPDDHFDAIFTYATHEHIPQLESALNEIFRVLRPRGVVLFSPAWHTRSWFAGGYAVCSATITVSGHRQLTCPV
ncbi:class I SAM-dependent methyltransferase [Mariprofundus ferrooxydans]|nr:class I SAM-dependent methyltransferase [Mariprofundus ferrooxydans]